MTNQKMEKPSKALHKIVFDMLVVRKEVILPDKIAEQENGIDFVLHFMCDSL